MQVCLMLAQGHPQETQGPPPETQVATAQVYSKACCGRSGSLLVCSEFADVLSPHWQKTKLEKIGFHEKLDFLTPYGN